MTSSSSASTDPKAPSTSLTEALDDPESVIRRVRALKGADVELDSRAVEAALGRHMLGLRVPTLPVEWAAGLRQGYDISYQHPEHRPWLTARDQAQAEAQWSKAERFTRYSQSIAISQLEFAAYAVIGNRAGVDSNDVDGSITRAASVAVVNALNCLRVWRLNPDSRRGTSPTPPGVARWLNVCLPLLDAAEAGLWMYWITRNKIVAVSKPRLFGENDVLHREDGPAVEWPGGEQYYFWRGVNVEPHVVIRPDLITIKEIQYVSNLENRRVLIERFGAERYIKETDSEQIHTDDFGTLYRTRVQWDEDMVVVKVVNSTPEPDGSYKDYYLRVPPTIRTARAAVAWTFGEEAGDYNPKKQT